MRVCVCVCVCGGRKQKISKFKVASTLENEKMQAGEDSWEHKQAGLGRCCSLKRYSEQASQRRTWWSRLKRMCGRKLCGSLREEPSRKRAAPVQRTYGKKVPEMCKQQPGGNYN